MGKYDGISIADHWAHRGKEVGKRWYARVRDQRMHRYRSKAFDTLDAAEEWARNEKARLQLGLTSAGTLLLASVADAYTEDLRRQGRTEHHVLTTKRILDSAVAAGVTDLKAPDVRDSARRWLAKARGKRGDGVVDLSPRTRNQYVVALKAAARWAVSEGMLTVNPLQGLKAARDPSQVQQREVFSPAELAEMVSDKHRKDERWMVAVLCVYFGLRLGEAWACRWSWFDWQGGVLNVQQEDDFSPKRDQERRVPIMTEARELLQPMAQLQGRLIKRELSRANRSREFIAYVEACGIQPNGRGAHCTRHSWVSLRLALGVPSLIVQREAGHTVIATTSGYTHALPPGWIAGWPKDGSGDFYLRRKLPKSESKNEAASR